MDAADYATVPCEVPTLMNTEWFSSWPASSATRASTSLPTGIDQLWARKGYIAASLRHRRRRYLRDARTVVSIRETLSSITDAQLRSRCQTSREFAARGKAIARERLEALATICEVARRQRGETPYPVQVAGALAMADGCIAEMATGEGKTLTASLVATLAGWRGKGCHVITVNDYLAQRDAEAMRGIYEFCGLSVGFINQDMSPPERGQAYRCDITYATNKDVTADYLRDHLAIGAKTSTAEQILNSMLTAGPSRAGRPQRTQRGLPIAIVDEIDSVLIDDAVTPLIISQSGDNDHMIEAFQTAATLAGHMEPTVDYRVRPNYQEVELTTAGRAKLHHHTQPLGGVFSGMRRSEELVTQALVAREFYAVGKQYIIDEGKVVIVDESTGRLMPDREWRDGLHQAVTAKEGLEVEAPKVTTARISFQRFFRKYDRLCGMTGTAREARMEFWDIYHLLVVLLPPNKPCIRTLLPSILCNHREDKYAAIVETTRQAHGRQQPVLIGTRSVEASWHLSEAFQEAGLEHQILNAEKHREEAQIVAQAGKAGRITIATNMAGRGTDIKLSQGVQELGGLYVILTERHDSYRVDRQLQGRCARQGEPGMTRSITCLDDELLARHGRGFRWVLRRCLPLGRGVRYLSAIAFHCLQSRMTRRALAQRKQVLRTDTYLDESLGFTGRNAGS